MRAGGTEPYACITLEPGVLSTEKAGGRFRDAWGVICVELTEFADSAGEALEWARTHKNSIPEFNLRLLRIEKEYEDIVFEHFLAEVEPPPEQILPYLILRQWANIKGVTLWRFIGPEPSEEDEELAFRWRHLYGTGVLRPVVLEQLEEEDQLV